MNTNRKKIQYICIGIFVFVVNISNVFCQSSRETILFNFDWKFALGHATDVHKDFNHKTSHFSYLAKTGYGDGAAAEKFDDRAWRNIQLPHDWCIGLPLDSRASNSHGNQAIGRNFPENSVGWYRKHFFIPKSDTSRRISIEFEGAYRDAKVFVNGFYVGGEESGYIGFGFDITEYLNFGGDNVIAVRVDATMEEGWFYEGAGIYRNVRLVKTNKVHFYNKFPIQIESNIVEKTGNGTRGKISVNWMAINESGKKVEAVYKGYVLDPQKRIIDTIVEKFTMKERPDALSTNNSSYVMYIQNPLLWSVEKPNLYTLQCFIEIDGKVVDSQEIPFGIRTIWINADKGLFINNVPIKIKGVCVHQDHAGVGVAIPYELQKWRIQQLKAIGVNAIRTSHNPPSPELLQICDELGMLVMDEVRLMGINEYHMNQVSRQIKRDRNHPSVFMWSLGNEEWTIEGNEKGAKIIEYMQKYAKIFDTSRPYTVAISGGWDTGTGMTADVIGYNYLSHGNIDEHHKKFPNQPSIGTEESNTVRTRGIYTTIDSLCWLAPKNLYDAGMEGGWKYYYDREFLSGLFYWTGFDYHGEPTPYGWPAVVSQFGILDVCGFPKDNAAYLSSWWTKTPTIQIESNWNRKPGEHFTMNIFSNAKYVELECNGKNLGKKQMERNGHIAWPITFEPGTLIARGYGRFDSESSDSTQLIITKEFKTAGKPAAIQIIPHKNTLQSDGQDVAICTVQIVDDKGIVVPDANVNISYEIKGEGKFIGVGNGNPSSHEKEMFEDKIEIRNIQIRKELPVQNLENRKETALGFDDSKWRAVYSAEPSDWEEYRDTLLVMRGDFTLDSLVNDMKVTLFAKDIVSNQVIYINGTKLLPNSENAYSIPLQILKKGTNEYAVTGKKLKRPNQWDNPNRDPGLIQVIYPSKNWNRYTFNGLSQVIVQSKNKPGTITITAKAIGFKPIECTLISK